MRLLVDTHVHCYPCFDAAALFESAFCNMRALAGDSSTAIALCLTETAGCHFFNRIRDEGLAWVGDFKRGDICDSRCIEIISPEGDSLYLFAGQQIVTRERIEILALLSDTDMPSGEPAEVSLRRVQESGAFAVFPWSFGKWLGRRGEILKHLLQVAKPGDCAVADSSLRPWWIVEPGLFRLAAERELPLLAGTDPFPFAGQEQLVGTFVSKFEHGFDTAAPAESLRQLFHKCQNDTRVGKRGSTLSFAGRLLRNRLAK